jgi:ABC-2 type transport system permease protein
LRSTLAIAWRDIRAVFVSPIAYVLLTGFLLLGGWFFFNLLGQFSRLVAAYSNMPGGNTTWLNLNDAVVGPLIQNLSIVLVIIIPMITMRSFAEERTSGTHEMLFTSPISVASMVAGKFLASAFIVTVMVGLSLVYPLILVAFGNPEISLIVSGFAGLYLVALVFVTIGNFTSAVTSNQIIATVSSLVILLLLFVVGWPADGASETLKSILLYASVTEHMSVMIRGVYDTKDIVYFVTLGAFFLFLTHRAVESARWK